MGDAPKDVTAFEISKKISGRSSRLLKNLRGKQSRFRWTISIKMYLALATFVLLIMLASLLGLNAISEMNNVQKTITQQRIPELTWAIKMGQVSVALMNTAPKLLAAELEADVKKVNALLRKNAEGLSKVLAQLKTSNPNGSRAMFGKYESLSSDLIGNLEVLQESVGTKLRLLALLGKALAQGVKAVQDVNRDLVSEIDDQTFFLYTGWKGLKQKKPALLSLRTQGSSLDYYRSLLSLKAQTQQASNLLSAAVNITNFDLVQPLRERFRAVMGNCKQALRSVQNKLFREHNFRRIEMLEQAGLAERSKSAGTYAGLFQLLDEIAREKQLQNTYLVSNQSIVAGLAAQTKQLIKDIQDAGTRTTQIFENTVSRKTAQLGFLSLISIILAFIIGFFLVGRHFIGRLKRLSQTMLVMSQGNLEASLSLESDDEITDMGKAMEVFRRFAVEAKELNLVQKLAKEVQQKNDELQETIQQLKKAQQQIVMQEKLASLGQLTSGIAHEIKNPLNFINNFSLLSKELLEELSQELAEPGNTLSEKSKGFIEDTVKDICGNMEKVHHHGQRANDIIKGMLQHSRTQVEDAKEVIHLNRFLESCVNLAYQGKRSSGSKFNVDIKKDYGEDIGELEVNPQDISRMVLNLITNACDAVEEKSNQLSEEERKKFSPCIWIQSKKDDKVLEIRVGDNGTGIPEDKLEKIFNPFFTTKATDKGTGLGLSLSHDIVLKNGGSIRAGSSAAGGAEFVVRLPLVASTIPTAVEDGQQADTE